MGWSYEIDRDGDLELTHEDGDNFYLPQKDFPQILALITPKVSQATPDGPWYMDGEYLKHRKQSDGYIIDTDVCDDHNGTAAWFVATQPEVSAEDWEYLTNNKAGSSACLRRLREIRAAHVAPTPDRVTFYMGGGSLKWRCGDRSETIFAAHGAEDRSGDVISDEYADMAAWLIKHQPAATVDQVLAWDTFASARENVCAFIRQQAGYVSVPADVAAAPETPVQRNVVITITFDPANTHAAETIYRAVNSIDWEYRRDSVRTRID